MLDGQGSIWLRNGHTFAEDFFITGNGRNNEGAIRSENNSNTISGTVTMTGNSRIHVNNTQLTLDGVLTQSGGNRNLEKTGAGTLILNNAGTNYSGSTTVSQGTLRANSFGALAATSSINLALALRWKSPETGR